MISWRVEAGGIEHEVSVSVGANDKHFIRVDGRVATSPLGQEDTERAISVMGSPYVVRRNGDSFELFPQEPEEVLETPEDSRRSMTRAALIWAVIVAFAALTFVTIRQRSYENSARERVLALLTEIHGGGESPKAMALWAGRRPADLMELSWMSDAFNHWRSANGLYEKSFSSYSVLSTRFLWKEKVPTVIVAVVLDGKNYALRVPKAHPIEWEGPTPGR